MAVVACVHFRKYSIYPIYGHISFLMHQIACINVRIYCNSYVISNDRVILCNEALSGIAVLATLIDLV